VVFVVCSNYSAAYSPTLKDNDNSALAVFAPTSIACVYMAMGYALKNVSGGILNPAVTVSLMLQRTLGKLEGLKMCAAQFAGGAAAGFATLFLYGWEPEANIVGPRDTVRFFVGAPLVEALYTCLLCFVYLNVNRDVLRKKREAEPSPPSDKSFFALAVGFVYIAGGVGGRYVSGGSFNPAVSVGVNFMGPNWKVITLPIYIAAQAVGALLAVLLFYIVRKDWYVSGTEDDAANPGEEAVEKAMAFGVGKLTKVVDPEDTCEFIGTLFISLTISLNQIAQESAVEAKDQANIFAAAGKVWSSAACLICLMYALADCSGGLFNPAVTMAYAVRFYNTDEGLNDKGKCEKIEGTPARLCDAKLSATETLKYLVFQLLGGAGGTGLTILVWLASGKWPVAAIQPGTYIDNKGVKQNCSEWQAMFAEFYGTFLICYVMVVVMLSKKGSGIQFGPFAVGGCVIAAGYAFGTLSGGFFNPAIVLGDAVGSKFQVVYTLPPLLYVCGQLLGGLLAGAVFRLFTHKAEVGIPEGVQSMKQQLIPVLP